jgi:translation initiation factor 1
MGKREQPGPAKTTAPFNPAFAGLDAKRGDVPPGPASPPPEPTPAAGGSSRPPPARAVVRIERAGRGGRTVTVIVKLGLPPREMESWLGELKRGIGCGGAVEGDALVLQGDVRERTGKLLEARGVKKVTVA